MMENSELAAISLSAKLPEFWTDAPRMWFAQFESVLAPQKQGDGNKYNLVVAKLGKEALQQVSDLIISPPEENKYTRLKERLLAVFEESAERQFQKLVGEMDLGLQRPSQLLRKMKELATNTQVSDEALKNLWLARLPAAARAVLIVSQDTKIENLALMADKIMENLRSGEVAAVSSSSAGSGNLEFIRAMAKMTLELQNLRAEVNEIRGRSLQRTFQRNRRNVRYRSRSKTPRRAYEDPNWLCRHHYKYRDRAVNCESQCNWKKKNQEN